MAATTTMPSATSVCPFRSRMWGHVEIEMARAIDGVPADVRGVVEDALESKLTGK